MSKHLTLYLNEKEYQILENLVQKEEYHSKSDCIRSLLRDHAIEV